MENSHPSWSNVLNPLGLYLDSSRTMTTPNKEYGTCPALIIFTSDSLKLGDPMQFLKLQIDMQVELLIDPNHTSECWATVVFYSTGYRCIIRRERVSMTDIAKFVTECRDDYFRDQPVLLYNDGRARQCSSSAITLEFAPDLHRRLP